MKKILYVDDEPVNLSNFRMSFEDEFEIITASSGEEGLDLFKQHREDGLAVIVSDNRMPGMRGIDLMERIYTADPDPVRIILTAYTDFEEVMQAVNKGHIYEYILKPWEEDGLRMRLRNACKSYCLTKANKNLLTELVEKNEILQDTARQLREELRHRKEEEELRRIAEVHMLGQAKLASLGEMATGIAHEINQPLTYIRVVCQSLQRDIEKGSLNTTECSADMDEVLRQVDRMATIIRHLLTFGRKEGGEFCQLHLPKVLDDTMILMRQRFKKSQIKLEIESERNLPLVCGAASRLEEVFLNLLSNAADALQERAEKRISVRFAAGEGKVSAVVCDSGCGMPPEVAAKVFEPFFTTKPTGKGTGLGLSIAYGIMNEHNGSIACQSKQGEGTCFTLALPAASES